MASYRAPGKHTWLCNNQLCNCTLQGGTIKYISRRDVASEHLDMWCDNTPTIDKWEIPHSYKYHKMYRWWNKKWTTQSEIANIRPRHTSLKKFWIWIIIRMKLDWWWVNVLKIDGILVWTWRYYFLHGLKYLDDIAMWVAWFSRVGLKVIDPKSIKWGSLMT